MITTTLGQCLIFSETQLLRLDLLTAKANHTMSLWAIESNVLDQNFTGEEMKTG